MYYYFYSTLYYCEKTSVFTVISCVRRVIIIIFLLDYKVGFSSITFILFILFRDRARKVHIINAVSESHMIIEHLSRKKVFIDDPYLVSNILERSEKFAKLDEDHLTAGLVIQDISH